jgi:peptide/nickel transport system permease protein
VILHALLRRLACMALTILLAAFLGAAMVRLAPGFGMDERQLDARYSASSREAIEEASGARSSLLSFFASYLAGLCRGEFGRSISFGAPVRELIADRFPLTLRSAAWAMLLAWTIAAATVLLLGLARKRPLEWAASGAAGALLCLPAAVVAVLSFYLGAAPALAIAAILLPRILRYLRTVTAAVTSRPHVLAARSRGCSGLGFEMRHVWLPAAPELLALGGISVNMALGAAIPVEALCDSPGLGQLTWKAALARDLPVLVCVTILMAAVTAAANLLSDAARVCVRREA